MLLMINTILLSQLKQHSIVECYRKIKIEISLTKKKCQRKKLFGNCQYIYLKSASYREREIEREKENLWNLLAHDEINIFYVFAMKNVFENITFHITMTSSWTSWSRLLFRKKSLYILEMFLFQWRNINIRWGTASKEKHII